MSLPDTHKRVGKHRDIVFCLKRYWHIGTRSNLYVAALCEVFLIFYYLIAPRRPPGLDRICVAFGIRMFVDLSYDDLPITDDLSYDDAMVRTKHSVEKAARDRRDGCEKALQGANILKHHWLLYAFWRCR